ncbi:MAG: DUF4215 domain-containing protein [Nannocystaceae bacterium]
MVRRSRRRSASALALVAAALATGACGRAPHFIEDATTAISGAEEITTSTTGDPTTTSTTAGDDTTSTTGDDTTSTTGPDGYCGDKILQEGEECDYGSANADYAPCRPNCTWNVCGDGVVLIGVEGCDAGEENADDAKCTSECQKNICGDGHRLKYIEECDEGEANADDAACTSKCQKAECGDGLVWAGVETCDDQNYSSGDGCSECTLENVVFVTDEAFQGDFGGLAGADAICQQAAKLSGMLPWPGDTLTYRAWLADPSCPPRDRLPHSIRPYVRVDGLPFADNWSDLVDGVIDTSLACTETHNYLFDEEGRAWSAVHGDGQNLAELPSRTCGGWTLSGDFFFGAVGDVEAKDEQWTRLAVGGEDSLQGCHIPAHLYCVMVHCGEAPEVCAPEYCAK